ncbi:alpha/beta fold hydrolase [Pseudanabaena mucicola]|uniref:Alpha/beta fold hydrolase n=1 Tax=Pseudanabaena mucicola FACHB-723 TaxID=2692860 RepID=A0ABR7ZZP6_9CYAN|nr:alpha/beta fold hydrolase [Pseudanabaena mucicola]MBD2189437.1 alpha/beta fold hydrolase [Pseudanabaena mucicola FACHB-723]
MSNLPPEVSSLRSQLTEATSIAMVDKIEYCLVSTSFTTEVILTSYVCDGLHHAHNSPILLLHGFDSSLLEFRRLLPQLAATHPTWAMDLFGFGLTERFPNAQISPEAIKEHLYYFWKTVIAKPIILVGASMGGAAAIDFALTYPDVVEKLILIGSAGMRQGTVAGKFLISPLDRMATNFLRSPKVRREVSLKAYADSSFVTSDAEVCASLHLAMPRWSESLISFTKSGGYGSFAQQLRYLKQDTLILWGNCDRILGTKDAAKFQATIPRNTLVWIENSGHVPHLERPTITAKEIIKFLHKS